MSATNRTTKEIFPLYLVALYNNLGAILDEYSETNDERLIIEGLLITCTELDRLSRDDGYWNAATSLLWNNVSSDTEVTLTLRPFDFDEFMRVETVLLYRAAVRANRISNLMDDLHATYSDITQNHKPRKVKQLRKRIKELSKMACQRQAEFLEANGFPKDISTSENLKFLKSCLRVIGGLVTVGVDVFGGVHVPPAAKHAKRSVKLGFSLAKNDLDILEV